MISTPFRQWASAPVAHPFRNIRACSRKPPACCDCAPWLASGYITSWALGRCCARMNRRGAILDHMGREKVGCCWLSAITLYAVIMQPPAAASNLDTSLGSLLRAGAENTSENKQPRARMTKLGEKVPTRVACLPDGGLGGWGCPARLYSPDILTASSCCQGAWGT